MSEHGDYYDVVNHHLPEDEPEEEFKCMKCRRISGISDCNNLQCPHCGGSMMELPDDREDDESQELPASVRALNAGLSMLMDAMHLPKIGDKS